MNLKPKPKPKKDTIVRDYKQIIIFDLTHIRIEFIKAINWVQDYKSLSYVTLLETNIYR